MKLNSNNFPKPTIGIMAKEQVTVSVIIPAYNRAKVISRAIESVLEQTYQDFEIIVVDDGSTDNTEEVVKNLSVSRLCFISSEGNKGAAVARNIGINVAKGEYIAFLDSDDEWLPQKLEKQIDLFERCPHVGAVFAGCIMLPSNRLVFCSIPSKSKKLKKKLLRSNILGSCSVAMVKKKCFDKVGLFNVTLPYLEDLDLWLRIVCSYEVKGIRESMVKIYCHDDDRITKDMKKKEIGIENFYKKVCNLYNPRVVKAALSYRKAQIGYWYYLYGENKTARFKIKNALKENPFSLKSWVYYFVTFFDLSFFKKLRRFFKNYEPLE